jgi:hypothetical protein
MNSWRVETEGAAFGLKSGLPPVNVMPDWRKLNAGGMGRQELRKGARISPH